MARLVERFFNRRRMGLGGLVDGMEGGLRLVEHLAILAFPYAKEEERQSRCGSPKLGSAGNFYFRLPAKELGGDEKAESGPNGERDQLNQNSPHWEGREHGVLQTADQICGGQENRKILGGFRQHAHWQSGAGKKNQGQPKELVQDLRLLHSIGHAGHDQAERGERDNSNGYEGQKRNRIAECIHVENGAGKDQLDKDGREGQDIVGEDARGEHFRG